MAKIVPIQTGNFSVGGVTYDVESVTLDGTQDIYEYIPLGQGDNPVAYKVVGGVIRLNGTIEASIGDDELGTGYLPAPFSRTLVTMIWTLTTGVNVTFEAAISNVNWQWGNDNMGRFSLQFESHDDITFSAAA